MDLFLKESAARFVLSCENFYLLSTFALFVSARVWQECRDLQMNQGAKQAWKHLLKVKSQKDVEREVLFEPEPWPVKALLRWRALRG